MQSDPITLGDWYAILDAADYAEAARLSNENREAPLWTVTFLMHWAPELITGREKWEEALNRKFVLDRLAIIESSAQQIAEILDSPRF
jgi:hypothetical protein